MVRGSLEKLRQRGYGHGEEIVERENYILPAKERMVPWWQPGSDGRRCTQAIEGGTNTVGPLHLQTIRVGVSLGRVYVER